jgi:hypothetical protein
MTAPIWAAVLNAHLKKFAQAGKTPACAIGTAAEKANVNFKY